MDQMKASTTSAQTASLAGQVDAQVMSDAVYIPYGYDTLLIARGKNVTNYYITSAYNGEVDLASLGTTQGSS